MRIDVGVVELCQGGEREQFVGELEVVHVWLELLDDGADGLMVLEVFLHDVAE